jgi:hypothetical protein
MTDRERACRPIRSSGVAWLVASAVLFLVGAAAFSGEDMRTIAAVGVGGAVAAVAIIVAFF